MQGIRRVVGRVHHSPAPPSLHFSSIAMPLEQKQSHTQQTLTMSLKPPAPSVAVVKHIEQVSELTRLFRLHVGDAALDFKPGPHQAFKATKCSF